MFFNGVMSIWILALLVVGATTLAGWRQGGIRAAIAFFGILVACLLAVPVGKIFSLLLPVLGVKSPITLWALAPVLGFLLVSILFSVLAFNVHRKVDVYYRYQAGDLRLAMWERLNTRLGICLGVLNGVIYFILISFLVFNLTYWTTQVAAGSKQNSFIIRAVNSLGEGLQATGFARASAAVGALPTVFYQYADVAGFVAQNPQAAPRLADYPALTSLWERDDMQGLVQDSALTNALATGASLGEIINQPSVQEFLKNKELTRHVGGILQTNMDDLMAYLQTGHSAKYAGEKILGRWQFNPAVTIAWLRQNQPKMQATEMRAIRALWTAAYAQTTVLFTADNKVFVKNFPRFQATTQPGQAPFTVENWSGDWSREDAAYSVHLTLGGQDRFMTATTADGLRLSVKDGRNQIVFDRAD